MQLNLKHRLAAVVGAVGLTASLLTPAAAASAASPAPSCQIDEVVTTRPWIAPVTDGYNGWFVRFTVSEGVQDVSIHFPGYAASTPAGKLIIYPNPVYRDSAA